MAKSYRNKISSKSIRVLAFSFKLLVRSLLVVVLQRKSKKCTKILNGRERLALCDHSVFCFLAFTLPSPSCLCKGPKLSRGLLIGIQTLAPFDFILLWDVVDVPISKKVLICVNFSQELIKIQIRSLVWLLNPERFHWPWIL